MTGKQQTDDTDNKITVNESNIEETKEKTDNTELNKEVTPSDLDSILPKDGEINNDSEDEEETEEKDEPKDALEKMDDVINEDPLNDSDATILEKIDDIADIIQDQNCDIEDKEKITETINDI